MFKGLKVTDHAKTAQHEARRFLMDKGYNVMLEVPIEYNEKQGYIDIVAIKDGIHYPIEFDRLSPRKKSILKVKEYCRTHPQSKPFVLLRGTPSFIQDDVQIVGIPLKEIAYANECQR